MLNFQKHIQQRQQDAWNDFVDEVQKELANGLTPTAICFKLNCEIWVVDEAMKPQGDDQATLEQDTMLTDQILAHWERMVSMKEIARRLKISENRVQKVINVNSEI